MPRLPCNNLPNGTRVALRDLLFCCAMPYRVGRRRATTPNHRPPPHRRNRLRVLLATFLPAPHTAPYTTNTHVTAFYYLSSCYYLPTISHTFSRTRGWDHGGIFATTPCLRAYTTHTQLPTTAWTFLPHSAVWLDSTAFALPTPLPTRVRTRTGGGPDGLGGSSYAHHGIPLYTDLAFLLYTVGHMPQWTPYHIYQY